MTRVLYSKVNSYDPDPNSSLCSVEPAVYAFAHITKSNHTQKRSLYTAQQRCTLAAELDTPWVTFRMRPPTLPYLMSSDTPSVTSFRRPMGFPKKSTEPRIWAAWLINSCGQETLHSNNLTQT